MKFYTVDSRRRITLGNLVEPGQVYEVIYTNDDGAIVLHPLDWVQWDDES